MCCNPELSDIKNYYPHVPRIKIRGLAVIVVILKLKSVESCCFLFFCFFLMTSAFKTNGCFSHQTQQSHHVTNPDHTLVKVCNVFTKKIFFNHKNNYGNQYLRSKFDKFYKKVLWALTLNKSNFLAALPLCFHMWF